MQKWQLHHVAEVIVGAPAERVWEALTQATETEQYFLRARVSVGEVGEAYRLDRDDGWHVTGIVLVKEPPHRLRVTWQVKTAPEMAIPNREVEFLVEPVSDTDPRTRLTVREYVDGVMPVRFSNSSRTGWAMITQGLKAFLR